MDTAESVLRTHLAEGTDLAIREVSFGMYWFEVAAVSLGLTLTEAWSASPDPLEHLRSTWANDTRP